MSRCTYTSEWGNVLQRGGLGGSSGNNDGVLHGVVLLERLDELGNGGSLLADGDVDTVELLGLVVGVVPSLLVEDGIETNGSLAGLTVTNDELTLATADGNHGVDGLETSLYGLVDGLSGQNARGLQLGTALLLGVEGALAVNGVTESVDDTAEQLRTNGNIDLRAMLVLHGGQTMLGKSYNLASSLDGLTLPDRSVGTEQHDTDLASLEVHAHALDARGEPIVC